MPWDCLPYSAPAWGFASGSAGYGLGICDRKPRRSQLPSISAPAQAVASDLLQPLPRKPAQCSTQGRRERGAVPATGQQQQAVLQLAQHLGLRFERVRLHAQARRQFAQHVVLLMQAAQPPAKAMSRLAVIRVSAGPASGLAGAAQTARHRPRDAIVVRSRPVQSVEPGAEAGDPLPTRAQIGITAKEARQHDITLRCRGGDGVRQTGGQLCVRLFEAEQDFQQGVRVTQHRKAAAQAANGRVQRFGPRVGMYPGHGQDGARAAQTPARLVDAFMAIHALSGQMGLGGQQLGEGPLVQDPADRSPRRRIPRGSDHIDCSNAK